jgi:hypothetical protein
MKRFYFAWGIAVVATFGLLAVAAANPLARTPVTDGEAAAVLGGATGTCACLGQRPCDPPCGTTVYWGDLCSNPSSTLFNPITCGTVPGCNTGYSTFGACVTTTPKP